MNLLANPGFEDGSTLGWAHWNNSSSVEATRHFGQYGANLGLLGSAGEGALLQELESGFTPGSSIYASAWVRTDGFGAYASVKVEFLASGSRVDWVESRRVTGSNDWTKLSVSATVPTNATSVKFLLYLWNPEGPGSSGSAFFDDAFLSADIPAAAWSWPMGQGLATVGQKRPDIGIDLIDDGIWNGVPIGGFGAGAIGRTFAGDYRRWHLDVGIHRVGSVEANQFSVFQRTGISTTAQVLWTWHPDGDPTNRPLKTWTFDYPGSAGTYYALFPKAWWDYSGNDAFPVALSCVQFSPIIPGNYQESSYPVGIYKWTARNRSTNAADVSVMLTWENMTGWDLDDSSRWRASITDPLWGKSQGSYNYARTEGDIVGVVLSSTRPATNEMDGEFCIAARQVPGVSVSYKGTFDCKGDGADIWNTFSVNGVLDNTDAQTVAGTNDNFGAAVAVSFHLEPGQEIVFPMTICWDLPFMEFGGERKGEAFASSEETYILVANDAFDGKKSTRWASAKTNEAWITYDFKMPRAFNRVALTWENAYAKSYRIEISNDATDWTVIQVETNGNGGVDVWDVGEQQAQYVMMRGLERGLPSEGYSLWEFEVMVKGTGAVASSQGPGVEADRAVDGSYTTWWMSDPNDGEWIYIDMGSTRRFNFVTLDWTTNYGKAYEIQISSNAVNWTTVATETDANGDMDVVYVGDQSARYVKMLGLQRGTASGYSLYEFSITHGAGPRKWYKYYTKFYGTTGRRAWDIARDALTNCVSWEQQIDAWQRSVLWDGGKPDWYKCALFNELYFLVDGGTAWENGLADGSVEPVPYEDNKYALLECFDWGNYAAFDLETYSSFALAHLWPELEKQVLRQAADMMDGTSSAQPCGKGSLLDGNVPHDASDSAASWRGDLDPWFRYNAYWNRDTTQWKDMNSKFMIRLYRDYQMTGDPGFLDSQLWQAAKLAMSRLRDRGDETSLPVNVGEDQTYDTWQMHGTSAYCGGLWLAALKAGIHMARLMGDTETEQLYAGWLDSALPAFESRLWNGSYYLYDTGSAGNSNCIMADQLCGEWFAQACGFSVLPEDHVLSALSNIYQYNVMGAGLNGRRGAMNGINPDGTINTSSEQAQEVWAGVTYGLSALMLHKGLLSEGEQTAWGAYHTVYEDKGYWFRTPEAWISNGNFRATIYNRPMAIWAMERAYAMRPAGCTAVASTFENTNYPAALAIDGNLATRWSSAAMDDQWICIDFVVPMRFDTLELTWEAAFASAYRIQVSGNAIDWMDIFTTDSATGGVEVVHVGAQTSRYVRLYFDQRATPWGVSLWEIQVFRQMPPAPDLLIAPWQGPGRGFVFEWPGTSDWTYTIYRATNLVQGFTAIASNVTAVLPINTYTDRLEGADANFYHIGIEP